MPNLMPRYRSSWALIIGIDEYEETQPLSHATKDAVEVAKLIQKRFDFPREQITMLLDGKARRDAIRKAFFAYAQPGRMHRDDRLFVFIAGHGHTVDGWRGDPVGFFVPVDGDFDDLASLIRWDELIRNADLIPAKHVFFVIDACYGGLASWRSAEGKERFIQDLLCHNARQVLSAGLSHQMVTDGDGVRPGHSLFTSYLLAGLEGEAATNGVITATQLMAYVRDRVGTHAKSRQTPRGTDLEPELEGDFVFNPESLTRGELGSSEGRDYVALLRAGVDRWNDWRRANPTVKPNLAGAKLAGLDLTDANLSGANLANADLSLSSLEGADLQGAILAGASLSEARLRNADFRGADLSRAEFRGAVLDTTDLTGAILENAKGLDATVLYGRSFLDHYALSSNRTLPERLLRACGIDDEAMARYRD